ncbi:MAG: hypothetical protein WCD86_23040 [Ktedonobacteraceae bacterium]
MGRVLEVIFRHPMQMLMLIVVLPIIGAGVAYFLPRTYESTASLWALHRYEVIGATGTESDLTATPAETQATALTELLQSRSFALSVASATSLRSTLGAATLASPLMTEDALIAAVQKVQIVSQGYSLYTLAYQSSQPQIAQQVLQAVIQNFSQQSQGLTHLEGQQLLDSYQSQLAKAKQASATAANAAQQYLLQHPEVEQIILRSSQQYAASIYPDYALLYQQIQQDQAAVQNIQASIATVQQQMGAQGTSAGSLFKVLDTPDLPLIAMSRMKTLLIAGGAGLGVALLACAIFILILVRRDHGIYTPLDVQNVTSLPILIQIPSLNTRMISLLTPYVEELE